MMDAKDYLLGISESDGLLILEEVKAGGLLRKKFIFDSAHQVLTIATSFLSIPVQKQSVSLGADPQLYILEEEEKGGFAEGLKLRLILRAQEQNQRLTTFESQQSEFANRSMKRIHEYLSHSGSSEK